MQSDVIREFVRLLPGWHGVLCPVLEELAGVDAVPHAEGAGGRLPVVAGHADDHLEPRPVAGGLELSCQTVPAVLSVPHEPSDEAPVD